MKGIILAGGLGTRLYPLTKITNKHLLPVWNRPMIHYPLQMLREEGIDEICLVVGGTFAGQFIQLLGNGECFNLKHLHYVYQEGEGGIAEALRLTRSFVEGEDVIVALGDNIFDYPIDDFINDFHSQEGPKKAQIYLAEVDDPCRFGNPEISEDDKIVRIIEKPDKPVSKYAVTGLYCYDSSVFDVIDTLVPSARGELEITDVNNAYLKMGALEHTYADGWWTDAGTFESLRLASDLVYKKERREFREFDKML